METQLELKGRRINLGSGEMKFSEKTIRKHNYLASIFFFLMAILYLIKSHLDIFDIGISSLYFLMSLSFLFKAHIELSKTSKYAPHFIISENGLKIKTGVFKKSEFIKWDDVKKIKLGYYKIGIKDRTGLHFYPYKTKKETSIAIKRSVEAIASYKGIELENLLKR